MGIEQQLTRRAMLRGAAALGLRKRQCVSACVTMVYGSITAVAHEPTQQRANPTALTVLVGLTVLALVLADQFITPALNRPEFNVQWFFRLLVLVIVLCIALSMLLRRQHLEISPRPAD